MAEGSRHPTAKIYQFPIRGRKGRNEARQIIGLIEATAPAAPVVDCASGWYHEAAIREAERAFRP